MEDLGTSFSSEAVIQTERREVDGTGGRGKTQPRPETGLDRTDSHVMLVRVAIADPLDRLRVPEQLLCGIIHRRLHTGRLVRSKDFQGDLFGGPEDARKVELLADLEKVGDRKRDRGGKGYCIVEGDGCGEQSVRNLCCEDVIGCVSTPVFGIRIGPALTC